MSDMLEISKENALSDARDLVEELGRPFKDEDITEYTRAGINLIAAAHRYVETYEGGNSFILDLKSKMDRYRNLTTKQARAALNVMRSDILGIEHKDPREGKVYNCFNCDAKLVGITELREHKKVCAGRKPKPAPVLCTCDVEGAPCEAHPEEEGAVIAVTESTLNLDLSGLPDGRYAAPDLNNDRENDFLFFSVRRTRKDKTRDRRYRTSKFRGTYGRERVPAGTIEVKEWSSDAKRLFGEQRPGDGEVYKGEFEEHLQLVMANPEAWGRIFGQMIGRCFRCGKKLTDELSRDQGFGPECAKHINKYKTY